MEALPPLPRDLAGVALFHLVGALPQLLPRPGGPSVYALTVFGSRPGARARGRASPAGGASLAGPAADADGLGAGWPAEARDAARALFEGASPLKAGAVVVVVIVQVGRVSHCALFAVPGGRARPRGRARARPLPRLRGGERAQSKLALPADG